MPPPTQDPAAAHLRALTYRFATTPATQLPALISRLPAHLAACQPLLAGGPAPSSATDAGALLHALRTRTSALLRDRSASARLAGVHLARGLLGAGGADLLRAAGGEWVRALVSLAARGADPPGARALALVAVVRACEAARAVEGAVREWVTPNLPAFISACLACAAERTVVETALRCMGALLPWHAGVFRPFITQVLKLIGGLLWIPRATVENDEEGPKAVEPGVREAAMEVYVLLHGAATKTGGLEDRDAGFAKAVDDARIAAKGNLFTNPTEPQQKSKDGQRPFVAKSADDLCCFLDMVGSYISTPSNKPMSMPAGKIVQLILDISAASPSNIQPMANEAKRDQFALGLPQLQASSLDLATLLIRRLNKAILPLGHTILQATANIFATNLDNPDVRIAVYATTTTLLPLLGPSLTRPQSKPLHPLIRSCTLDTAPPPPSPSTSTTTISTAASTKTGTNPSRPADHALPATTTPLRTAALSCLTAILAHVPAPALPAAQRADLERAAVLARDAGAMRAAVLNPRAGVAGLLPVAVRAGGADAGLEGVVRARVPPLAWGAGGADADGGGGDDDRAGVEDGAAAAVAGAEKERAVAGGSGPGLWGERGDGAFVRGGERAADAMEVDEAEEESEPALKRRRVLDAWAGAAPGPVQSPPMEAVEASDCMAVGASGGSMLERTVMAGEAELPSPQLTAVADRPVSDASAIEQQPIDTQFSKHTAELRKETVEDEDMSDDDDGSDFEMPPLIPRRDFEDDEEEDEDGGSPLL
jgi:hypothetical protein